MDKTKRDRKVLFAECEIFIDYFSSQTGGDRSLRLGNELEKKYGAKIVQQPHPQTTTHLIFKNGNLQTKLFAQKHRLPLLDPLWLESSIRKRRLVSLDKYRVPFDENQPQEDLPFHRLTLGQKDSPLPSTPKTQNDLKKTRKVLYTPNREEFDQGNPHEFFDHEQRRITLDQLGLNLQEEEHQLIHRYGCAVARRQNPPPPPPVEERTDSPSPSNDFLPSQSQSSPRVHFAGEIRSLSSTIDFAGERPSVLLAAQPQSTPKSSPILRPRRTTTADEISLTKVTPMRTKPTEKEDEEEEENVRMPRAPPLLALSQRIRRKHPEEPLIDPLPSIGDLPDSPANYSFVFYQFSPTQIDEAKRLTRRMGDCFALESVDISTTHLIVHQDDPQLNLNFDFLLALLSGCRIVTFEWLKSSAKIGEWLSGNAFEPRRLFQSIPSLNIYRKSRQQNKPMPLFQQSGRIYLTSLVQQRANLLKLIHLLGGDITVNRNQANIVIGASSKNLPVRIYPQVTERWVLDSIVQGQCLPADAYLLDD